MLKRALLTAALLTAATALAACGSDDSGSDAPASASCSYRPDGSNPPKKTDLPPEKPTETGQVPATITTSVGDLKLTLDADKAPCTVSSFASLAKQGFWEGTYCHRMSVAEGFVFLQCGDPHATDPDPAALAQAGQGSPGYTVPDEYDGTETYPAGAVAMANTGQPDTGGSQFFLVFGDTELAPTYTVFATMDEASIKLLQGVGAGGVAVAGADGSGPPTKPVEFQKVTVG
jgi:peptidyl-prolyl cis-trans isomerase B (cyclophilin B)